MHLTDQQYDDLNQQLAEVEMEKSLNTTQHTPGPWTAYNAINGRVLNYWHVSAGGIGIAELRNLKHNDQIANATLIAAAPDLLAALENVVREIQAHHQMTVRKDYSLMVALVAANKVIAKATQTL